MSFWDNKIVLFVLLMLAAILLVTGLTAPIITFNKFIFIQNTFSILTACWNLLKEGQIFLFLVISIFSVILPIVKVFILAKLIYQKSKLIGHANRTILNWLHRFGKWSMLDVFVVAILVVVVKLGAIGNVEKHFGLYAYCAAAILIMFITHRMVNIFETKTG